MAVVASVNPIDEFRLLTESICDLLEREGVTRFPYTAPSLPLFSKLPFQDQQAVVAHLRDYNQACVECVQGGSGLSDSPVLLWKMLKLLNFAPSEDLFTLLTRDHIVEVYTPDNVQIFRNFQFFKFCSYSLEELFCKQWWELYRRDDMITQRVFAVASGLFSGEVRGTVEPNISTHLMEETSSALRFRVHMSTEYLSPLSKNGKIVGICALHSAELLNDLSDHSQLKELLEAHYRN